MSDFKDPFWSFLVLIKFDLSDLQEMRSKGPQPMLAPEGPTTGPGSKLAFLHHSIRRHVKIRNYGDYIGDILTPPPPNICLV